MDVTGESWPVATKSYLFDIIMVSMAKKSFPLRISGPVFDLLKDWADDEFRSVNGQIEFLLREALRREGRLKNPPTNPLTTPPQSSETE